jgi:hypothetical protein
LKIEKISYFETFFLQKRNSESYKDNLNKKDKDTIIKFLFFYLLFIL